MKQMNGNLFFRAVRYRPVLAGGIFVLSQIVGVFAWFKLPHLYKVEAAVLVDMRNNPAQVVAKDAQQNVLAVKVGLLQSRLLVDRVVDRLNLRNNQVLRESWEGMGPKRPSFDEWLANLTAGGLIPGMSAGSYVLKVGYASASEEFSVTMANAFAEELVGLSDLLNRGYDQFVGQAYGLTTKSRYDEFVAAQNAVIAAASKDAQSTVVPESALRAFLQSSKQANNSVSDYIQTEAANQSVAGMRDMGGLMDDKFLQAQQAALADLRTQRDATATSMGASHPVVKALDSTIRSKEGSIRQHETRLRAALAVRSRATADAAAQLTQQQSERKASLLAAEGQRQGYDSAMQEAEEKGARYEDALTQDAIIELDRDAPRSDVRVIAAAAGTGGTWLPLWYYYFPISLAMGVLYAFLGAYMAERRDRRVRTEADINGVMGLPVINVLRRIKG